MPTKKRKNVHYPMKLTTGFFLVRVVLVFRKYGTFGSRRNLTLFGAYRPKRKVTEGRLSLFYLIRYRYVWNLRFMTNSIWI